MFPWDEDNPRTVLTCFSNKVIREGRKHYLCGLNHVRYSHHAGVDQEAPSEAICVTTPPNHHLPCLEPELSLLVLGTGTLTNVSRKNAPDRNVASTEQWGQCQGGLPGRGFPSA